MILGTRSPFLRKSQLHMNVKEKRVTTDLQENSMIDQGEKDITLMMAKGEKDITMVHREEEEEDLMTEREDDTMMIPMWEKAIEAEVDSDLDSEVAMKAEVSEEVTEWLEEAEEATWELLKKEDMEAEVATEGQIL